MFALCIAHQKDERWHAAGRLSKPSAEYTCWRASQTGRCKLICQLV